MSQELALLDAPCLVTPRPSVCCVIFRPGTSGADVLLHQRSDNKLWGMPGGALEYGESLEQAARREILEETGLSIDVLGVAAVHSDPATGAVFPYPDGNNVHYVCHTLVCVNPTGSLHCSAESDVLCWFPYEVAAESLPTPFSQMHRKRLETAWAALQDQSKLLPLG